MISHEELAEHVEQAALAAYSEVAEYFRGDPNEIHAMPYCRAVTNSIMGYLQERSIDANPVVRRGERIDEHRYLKFGEMIIDATWQQFIPPNRRSDDLPKVYIGSREGLQDLVDLNGAATWVARLWDVDGPGRMLTVQERVAAAYDSVS